jgi:hypothetical protein
MNPIVLLLNPSPPICLQNGLIHGRRHFIPIENHLSVHIPGSPAKSLDERLFGSEETLLVGIEDRDERDLRKIEPFPQKIDANEDIKLPQPKFSDNLNSIKGINVGMEIFYPNTKVRIIFGEILFTRFRISSNRSST